MKKMIEMEEYNKLWEKFEDNIPKVDYNKIFKAKNKGIFKDIVIKKIVYIAVVFCILIFSLLNVNKFELLRDVLLYIIFNMVLVTVIIFEIYITKKFYDLDRLTCSSETVSKYTDRLINIYIKEKYLTFLVTIPLLLVSAPTVLYKIFFGVDYFENWSIFRLDVLIMLIGIIIIAVIGIIEYKTEKNKLIKLQNKNK